MAYVERVAVRDMLHAEMEAWGNSSDEIDALLKANDKLFEIPSADVAPVVHAKWDGEKDHGDFREVKCTACGGILLVKWSTRLSEYNYCPNCGARMDGAE